MRLGYYCNQRCDIFSPAICLGHVEVSRLFIRNRTHWHEIFFRLCCWYLRYPGGFHVTSSPPCWWTKTKDLSLAPAFVCPPTIVHCSIVICVSRDWLLTTSSDSREQEWRSGESTHLPPMWPWLDSQTRRHMWVEFVGSLLCTERFFSGYSGFPGLSTCIGKHCIFGH